MPTERLAIIGTGGQAKVVVDALLELGWEQGALDFYSEDQAVVGLQFAGTTIRSLAGTDLSAQLFHVAIGSNAARRRIAETLSGAGGIAFSIAHPRATRSASSLIGPGCFLAAGAIVAPHSELGLSCIVNHGAIVDHDCHVADYCHVAPAATLGGGVTLHSGVLVGAGANILPNVAIGANAVIGAGAVVHRGVPTGATYVGIPARKIQESRT